MLDIVTELQFYYTNFKAICQVYYENISMIINYIYITKSNMWKYLTRWVKNSIMEVINSKIISWTIYLKSSGTW